jgi:hypothetical protein
MIFRPPSDFERAQLQWQREERRKRRRAAASRIGEQDRIAARIAMIIAAQRRYDHVEAAVFGRPYRPRAMPPPTPDQVAEALTSYDAARDANAKQAAKGTHASDLSAPKENAPA